MSAGRADLHVHSTASDGRVRPAELVRMAWDEGLAGLALTDHDTCGGLAEAERAAREAGIRFLPGVELSAEGDLGELHILGYAVPTTPSPLTELLERMRRGREERMERMVARLREHGLPVTMEDVREEAAGGAPGRPHLARVLVRRGYAEDVRDAFARYLVPDAPGYVPRMKLSPETAVATLRESGAVPVWAHPGDELAPDVLERLVAHGLAGIECVHPDMTAAQSEACLRAAEERGLIATGGSDFHGPGERVPLGTVTVPLATIDAVLEAAGA